MFDRYFQITLYIFNSKNKAYALFYFYNQYNLFIVIKTIFSFIQRTKLNKIFMNAIEKYNEIF